MKKLLIPALALMPLLLHADGPWKAVLRSQESNVSLTMDLLEESVEVPGLEMFGPMNGYMSGNIYGVWMISHCKVINEKQAEIKLSNDLGSETQSTVLTWTSDSTATMELTGSVVMKRRVDKKLEKIEPLLRFRLE